MATVTAAQLFAELQNVSLVGQDIWLQLDVDGKPHHRPLGSFAVVDGRFTLVAEPEPVPDPVIVAAPSGDDHRHIWSRDVSREEWRCVALDCEARVTFEQLLNAPIPQTEAEGIEILNAIAGAPNVGP